MYILSSMGITNFFISSLHELSDLSHMSQYDDFVLQFIQRKYYKNMALTTETTKEDEDTMGARTWAGRTQMCKLALNLRSCWYFMLTASHTAEIQY